MSAHAGERVAVSFHVIFDELSSISSFLSITSIWTIYIQILVQQRIILNFLTTPKISKIIQKQANTKQPKIDIANYKKCIC